MTSNKREKIIHAAKKSFAMFGFKGTTVDQIAKIANVGKGTIYTYFEDKEVLLQEIIQSLVSEMKHVAEQTIQSDKTVSENLHASIYGILVFRKEHELLIKLSQEVKEIGTPAVVDVLESFESEVINYIKVILINGMNNNKIKKCDPEITAYLMFKMYVSLLFDWGKKHEPLSDDQIYQLFELYFMKGIAVQQ